MKLARSTYYYRSRSAAEKIALCERIGELAAEFQALRLSTGDSPAPGRGTAHQSQGGSPDHARKRSPGAPVAPFRAHYPERS